MELKIKLNGSNYVSERTREAFEEALEDGHQINLAQESAGETVEQVERSEPEPVQLEQPAHPPSPPAAQVDLESQLQLLERGMDRSYEHQQEILRVHEQYLRNQADYAGVFSQLMEHQRSLLSQEDGTPEHTQALLAVLDHLSKSLSQFHEHQGETLTVHDRFLHTQSEYAQAHVQLLQKQAEIVLDGQTPVRMPAPARRARDRAISRQRPADPDQPIELAVEDTPAERSELDPQGGADQGLKLHSKPEPSTSTGAVDPAALTSSLLDCVSDATGYPAEMLDLDMDMEADLGIDSIKRVEILGTLQDAYPGLPAFESEDLAELRTLGEIVDYAKDRSNGHHGDVEAATVDAAADPIPNPDPEAAGGTIEDASAHAAGNAVPDPDTLKTALLEIVSESTGYPAEMLELDMDMEADLGIDSIKRVEILGALQDAYPNLPQVEAEVLGELRTLGEILGYMDDPPPVDGAEDPEVGPKKA